MRAHGVVASTAFVLVWLATALAYTLVLTWLFDQLSAGLYQTFGIFYAPLAPVVLLARTTVLTLYALRNISALALRLWTFCALWFDPKWHYSTGLSEFLYDWFIGEPCKIRNARYYGDE